MSVAYVDAFLEHLVQVRDVSPKTAEAYAGDAVQFMNFLAATWGEDRAGDFGAVTYGIVRRYVAHLHQAKYGRRSVARKLSSLRSFFDFLVTRELVKHNPAALVRAPKLEKNLPEFLYNKEMELLLAEPDVGEPLGLRDRAMLEFLYATGCRRAELVGLNVADLDLPSLTTRVIGKRNKERIVCFGEPCRDVLEAYLGGAREGLLRNAEKPFGEPAVFLSRLGRRISPGQVNKIVEKYVLKVGASHRITPHKLRHTFATHLLDAGADLRTIQELLGHVNLTSTEIYTHVSAAGLSRVYQAAHPLAARKDLS
jgi:integrase/recombinase XerC